MSTDVDDLPLLPLRDIVIYPHMVTSLFVGRESSILALEKAMSQDKQILLVAQKKASIDNPQSKDIYTVGTVSNVLQMLKLPDGTIKILVEGERRVHIEELKADGKYLVGRISELQSDKVIPSGIDVLLNALVKQFETYVNLRKKVPPEVLASLANIDDPERLVDTVAAHVALEFEQKQVVLEIFDITARIEYLMELMDVEIDLFKVEKRVRGRVKKQMEDSQREYYLNEQMKAIQKELGDMHEEPNEIEEIKNKIKKSGMSKEALKKVEAELQKLKMMAPMSAEASVVRSYIDWMINVPWKKRSKVKHDLKRAKEILDKDHYGLKEVKERILEYLAVQKRVKKVKGSILCLVGPPGVGKTSLGESIARSTNRKFVRVALGGVRDEAEIRGHRRTYIGSMPGKIIQRLSKVGVQNPLFLFDEIDKMGMDYRGDPSSALLEVLDPEQNSSFNDHYLEVDYDLSDIMFICTANSMDIPAPLLDRMEVIRIPGYTEDEKLNIATRYLKPKQMRANGLKDNELEFSEEALRDIIRYYTREAGVRGLEREIAKICRKVVKQYTLSEKTAPLTITPELVEDYSGVRKFSFGKAEEENQVGQVTGLAWTQVGGELLVIEAASIAGGKGNTVRTGSLGDVMLESIQAALTVVKSRSQSLGIPESYYAKHDLHIHVPEGATPKDGPSAGIGMCTALVSILTGIPVRSEVAMTGEITLRGEVLKIGGLKEKLLAAHRGGITTVVIPEDNSRDLKEIPDNIKADLDIKAVKWIEEVLEIALERLPEPISDEEYLGKNNDISSTLEDKVEDNRQPAPMKAH